MREDFNELLGKVQEWSPDDEDIVRKEINYNSYYAK